MSDNSRKRTKRKNNTKKKKISIFRIVLVVLLIIIFISAGAVGGLVLGTIKNAPKIDPNKALTLLNEHSKIYDKNGNLIEKIQTKEFRTIVDLNEISDNLESAVIAVEDERFRTHIGIDPKRIIGAFIDDIRAGEVVAGASTITQQLIKNLYLMEEVDREVLINDIKRKIKEAYLAIQLERYLSKDQILKAYLNTIFLGQNAYGVQEAAQTYFSKDASNLTIAESAMIAAIPKSTKTYTPYRRYNLENVGEDDYVVGYVEVLGEKYAAVFNEKALERQKIVLSQMKKLNMITEEQYQNALNEDMKKAVKPGSSKNENIETSYFSDYVKRKVVDDLIKENGYSKEEAQNMLYTGGLQIYSTMDINLQAKVENVYDNFVNIFVSDIEKEDSPILIKKKYTSNNKLISLFDKNSNIIDEYKHIVYYKKDNLLDDNNNIIIEKGTYSITDSGNIVIKNNKINYRNLDLSRYYGGYYTIDESKNLVTHSGYLALKQENYEVDKDNKQLIIKNTFIVNNPDFYKIDKNENLIINSIYLCLDTKGVVQPQSSVVILDYRTGEVKALVGGRKIKDRMALNRAVDSPRQPGSSIKPLSVYLPALDNGFTAATIIDDTPHYNKNGKLWPQNWYGALNSYQRQRKDDDYKGLVTVREAVELSINVASVKILERIGIDTSVEYLTRLGIINEENPKEDSFITRMESSNSDEDYAPLALGGMRRGITPMKMTAAYSAIANRGIYTEPIVYTKVLDNNGNVILEKRPSKNTVVTPQVAYLMTDILRSAITNGTGNRAKLFNYNTKIPVAGKTGTTQNQADAWFVGFTPYYAAGVWIGNDKPVAKLDSGSKYATMLWKEIMKQAHDGLPDKDFEKPQGFITKIICTESGKLATELCERDPRGSTVKSEIFIQGTEPREFCDTHIEVAIDTSNGKLATEFCPPELVENKVFIKRNPPYNPEEHDEYVPADFIYTVPTEICDEHLEPEESENWFDEWFSNSDDEEENSKNKQNDQENKIDNKIKNKVNDIMDNVDNIIDDIVN